MVVGVAEDEVVMIINAILNERLTSALYCRSMFVCESAEHYRCTCASSF